MRVEIIRCDQCQRDHDAQFALPPEWIRTIQITRYELEEEHHFCSLDCLYNWIAEAMLEGNKQS